MRPANDRLTFGVHGVLCLAFTFSAMYMVLGLGDLKGIPPEAFLHSHSFIFYFNYFFFLETGFRCID